MVEGTIDVSGKCRCDIRDVVAQDSLRAIEDKDCEEEDTNEQNDGEGVNP